MAEKERTTVFEPAAAAADGAVADDAAADSATAAETETKPPLYYFESRGFVGRDFYRRNINLIFRRRKYNIILGAIALAGLAISLALQLHPIYAGLYSVCALIFVINAFVAPAMYLSRAERRDAELGYPGGTVLICRFGDGGIDCLNETTGAAGRMEYGALRRIAGKGRECLIFTASGMFLTVFFEGEGCTALGGEAMKYPEIRRAAFIDFLKTKPTKIKWKK